MNELLNDAVEHCIRGKPKVASIEDAALPQGSLIRDADMRVTITETENILACDEGMCADRCSGLKGELEVHGFRPRCNHSITFSSDFGQSHLQQEEQFLSI